MSKSAIIPRFLLPQLSWRKAVPWTVVKLAGPVQIFKHLDHSRSKRRSTSHSLAAINHICHPRFRIASQPGVWNFQELIDLSNIYRALSRSRSTAAKGSTATVGLIPHRSFHTSRALYRDHHFDTLKFVQRLRDEGFSEEQATAMMRVLSDVIEESIQNLTRTMVLREGSLRSLFWSYSGP